MTVGSHVFGPDRLGVWVIQNSNLKDKLIHVLPRLRNVLPFTDVYLPIQASASNRLQVQNAGFFSHVYDVAHDKSPTALADEAVACLSRIGGGALELDIELPDDSKMDQYCRDVVARVRYLRPNLRLRLNVAPYKGYVLPADLITADPNLFVIAQAYFGNQDGRLSESEVLLDLIDHGIPVEKAAIMYAALAENTKGQRVFTLPNPAYKPLTTGSVFSDDLMLEAGLLP